MKKLLFRGVTVIHQSFFQWCSESGKSGDYEKRMVSMKQGFYFKHRKMHLSIFRSTYIKRKPSSYFEFEQGFQITAMVLPSGAKISGTIRVYVTIYRVGFLAVSIVIPIRHKDSASVHVSPGSKVLTSTKSLTSDDLLYLLEAKIPGMNFPAIVNGQVETITIEEMEDIIRTHLRDSGVLTSQPFSRHDRMVHFWDLEPVDQLSSISDIAEKYPEEIFPIMATPKKKTRITRAHMTNDLKNAMKVTSKNYGHIMSKSILLTFHLGEIDRKMLDNLTKRSYGYGSPLVILYQLAKVQEYGLAVFSEVLKKVTMVLQEADVSDFGKIVKEIFEIRRKIVLFSEDLYWVGNEMKNVASQKALERYREEYEARMSYEALMQRLEVLKTSTEEVYRILENEAVRKRETRFKIVSLFFGAFSIGQIVSAFIIWYYSSVLVNVPFPIAYFSIGLSITTIIVLLFTYIAIRWL